MMPMVTVQIVFVNALVNSVWFGVHVEQLIGAETGRRLKYQLACVVFVVVNVKRELDTLQSIPCPARHQLDQPIGASPCQAPCSQTGYVTKITAVGEARRGREGKTGGNIGERRLLLPAQRPRRYKRRRPGTGSCGAGSRQLVWIRLMGMITSLANPSPIPGCTGLTCLGYWMSRLKWRGVLVLHWRTAAAEAPAMLTMEGSREASHVGAPKHRFPDPWSIAWPKNGSDANPSTVT